MELWPTTCGQLLFHWALHYSVSRNQILFLGCETPEINLFHWRFFLNIRFADSGFFLLTLALIFSHFCELYTLTFIGTMQCHVEPSVEADSDTDSIKLIHGAEADQIEEGRS